LSDVSVIAGNSSLGTEPPDRAVARRDRPTSVGSGTLLLGVSGARQNASVAAVVDGRLEAFCEQERVTRVRSVALEDGVLPQAALDAVLTRLRRTNADIAAFATAEAGARLPEGILHREIEHHRAHAAVAAFTSPFDSGLVLVCDQHSEPAVTVWRFHDGELRQHPWPWNGPGFASLYSECARLFAFPPRSEHRLEALARVEGGSSRNDRLAAAIRYDASGFHLDESWRNVVADLLGTGRGSKQTAGAASVASTFQRSIGDALVALLSEMHRQVPAENLCLAGGLFYNTYLNTRVVESALFSRVFVPANPGNAGLAAGAPLALAGETQLLARGPADPFLGPEYAPDVIKATLDNCKLTYDYVGDQDAVDIAVKALLRGELVGWFQGAMEWGPRSLGNRSILANPFAPYVLENLNAFLKQREPYRAYGLSVCVEDAPKYFSVPAPSAFMELEYSPHEGAMFRHAMPEGVRRLRVQTIGDRPPLFRALHRAFGEATGAGVLVNTSFNGFHEPMVCSPRDAIRVFYGGGLDLAVLGGFVLRK
jgi:carbamoyltransferase